MDDHTHDFTKLVLSPVIWSVKDRGVVVKIEGALLRPVCVWCGVGLHPTSAYEMWLKSLALKQG